MQRMSRIVAILRSGDAQLWGPGTHAVDTPRLLPTPNSSGQSTRRPAARAGRSRPGPCTRARTKRRGLSARPARIGSSRLAWSIWEAGCTGCVRLRPLWREAASPVPALPPAGLADLRTDHAGAVGDVQISRGILALSRDGEVRAFAAQLLATELLRLRRIRHPLPTPVRARVLPLWRVAGWLTGALSALFRGIRYLRRSPRSSASSTATAPSRSRGSPRATNWSNGGARWRPAGATRRSHT